MITILTVANDYRCFSGGKQNKLKCSSFAGILLKGRKSCLVTCPTSTASRLKHRERISLTYVRTFIIIEINLKYMKWLVENKTYKSLAGVNYVLNLTDV